MPGNGTLNWNKAYISAQLGHPTAYTCIKLLPNLGLDIATIVHVCMFIVCLVLLKKKYDVIMMSFFRFEMVPEHDTLL